MHGRGFCLKDRSAFMRKRVRDQLEDWQGRKFPTIAPRTQDVYRAAIAKLPDDFLAMRLGKVLPRDVEAVLLPLTPAMRKQTKAVLSGVFKDAKRNRLIDSNPVEDVELSAPAKAPRSAVEPREVDKLALLAPERYKALILVAAYAGLRLGEAMALTPNDVRLDAETIRVSKQWNYRQRVVTSPKTRAGDRTTIFATKIRPALEYQLSTYSNHLVFPGAKGTYFDVYNFRNRVWRKHTQYHYHDLRHTFASLLIREGVNVAMIAKLMGHADPSVTLRIYAHFFQDDYQEARNALNSS